MSAVNEVHAVAMAPVVAVPAVRKPPFWKRRAVLSLRLSGVHPDRLAVDRTDDQSDLLFLSHQDRAGVLRTDLRHRRAAALHGREPADPVLRARRRDRGRRAAGGPDGALPDGRLGARFAGQRHVRDPDGRIGAAAGAVVRHLHGSQGDRGVFVLRVSDPDQHLSGRARMRQEHARGRALVPLQRMADVARRAVSVRAALHRRRRASRHRPRTWSAW